MAVFGDLGKKIPVVDDGLSFHEHEIYPTTSLKGNCAEFEFQTDWNNYVDLRQMYLALKLTFVKDCGYEIYKNKQIKSSMKKKQRRMKKRRQRRSKGLQIFSLLM